MINNKLKKINKLIEEKKIDEAQLEISKLNKDFYNDPEYLYLRSKIFFVNKLYYIAVDTLLIALEFEQSDKIYNLLSKIYNILGNKELSNSLSDLNLRFNAADSLKDEMSGIYRKEN